MSQFNSIKYKFLYPKYKEPYKFAKTIGISMSVINHDEVGPEKGTNITIWTEIVTDINDAKKQLLQLAFENATWYTVYGSLTTELSNG